MVDVPRYQTKVSPGISPVVNAPVVQDVFASGLNEVGKGIDNIGRAIEQRKAQDEHYARELNAMYQAKATEAANLFSAHESAELDGIKSANGVNAIPAYNKSQESLRLKLESIRANLPKESQAFFDSKATLSGLIHDAHAKRYVVEQVQGAQIKTSKDYIDTSAQGHAATLLLNNSELTKTSRANLIQSVAELSALQGDTAEGVAIKTKAALSASTTLALGMAMTSKQFAQAQTILDESNGVLDIKDEIKFRQEIKERGDAEYAYNIARDIAPQLVNEQGDVNMEAAENAIAGLSPEIRDQARKELAIQTSGMANQRKTEIGQIATQISNNALIGGITAEKISNVERSDAYRALPMAEQAKVSNHLNNMLNNTQGDTAAMDEANSTTDPLKAAEYLSPRNLPGKDAQKIETQLRGVVSGVAASKTAPQRYINAKAAVELVAAQNTTLGKELLDSTGKLKQEGLVVAARFADMANTDPTFFGKPEQHAQSAAGWLKLHKENIDIYPPIPNTEEGQKRKASSITILSSPGDPARDKELRQVATWLQNMKPGDVGTMEALLAGLALSKEKQVSIQARMAADDIKHLTPVQKLQLIYSGLVLEKDAVPPKAAPSQSSTPGKPAPYRSLTGTPNPL
jgi:hypothetical protein